MTWNEFKKCIDDQIEDMNIDKDLELEYIDISYPCLDHPSCQPTVYADENGIAIQP
jgi:hypothetical protein